MYRYQFDCIGKDTWCPMEDLLEQSKEEIRGY